MSTANLESKKNIKPLTFKVDNIKINIQKLNKKEVKNERFRKSF